MGQVVKLDTDAQYDDYNFWIPYQMLLNIYFNKEKKTVLEVPLNKYDMRCPSDNHS